VWQKNYPDHEDLQSKLDKAYRTGGKAEVQSLMDMWKSKRSTLRSILATAENPDPKRIMEKLGQSRHSGAVERALANEMKKEWGVK
jgi:hypothetical protein